MLYTYFGHHKCASTWVRQIVEEVLRETGYRYGMVFDRKSPCSRGPLTDYEESFSREHLEDYADRAQLDFLSCITADIEHAQALPSARGFHIIRDPRDIIVSGYFSHRNSHPTDGLPHYATHREALRSVSKEEGLLLEMDFSAQCIRDLATWNYNQEHVLEVKMEELTTNPYRGFLEIFEFLGLLSWSGEYIMKDKTRYFLKTSLNRLARRHPWLSPLRRKTHVTGDLLLGRVYDHRFEKITDGRKVGQADANSHYRKGVAGDWVNHFSPVHIEYFTECFGDVLQTTGYETGPWTPQDLPSPPSAPNDHEIASQSGT